MSGSWLDRWVLSFGESSRLEKRFTLKLVAKAVEGMRQSRTSVMNTNIPREWEQENYAKIWGHLGEITDGNGSCRREITEKVSFGLGMWRKPLATLVKAVSVVWGEKKQMVWGLRNKRGKGNFFFWELNFEERKSI